MENSTFDLSIRYTWERKDKYTTPLDAYILFMVNRKALDYTHAHAVPVTRFRNSMNIYCETERDLKVSKLTSPIVSKSTYWSAGLKHNAMHF